MPNLSKGEITSRMQQACQFSSLRAKLSSNLKAKGFRPDIVDQNFINPQNNQEIHPSLKDMVDAIIQATIESYKDEMATAVMNILQDFMKKVNVENVLTQGSNAGGPLTGTQSNNGLVHLT